MRNTFQGKSILPDDPSQLSGQVQRQGDQFEILFTQELAPANTEPAARVYSNSLEIIRGCRETGFPEPPCGMGPMDSTCRKMLECLRNTMDGLTKLLLAALLACAGWQAWQWKKGQDVQKLAQMAAESQVTVYGPKEYHGTRVLEERLRMRGISYQVIPVQNAADLKTLGVDRLKSAGVMDSVGSADLPFYSVNGEFVPNAEFKEVLSQLPPKFARERSSPYITAYGVVGCAYTARGLQMLKDQGLPFEFRDVNDPTIKARFDALLADNGIAKMTWPVLDVNGQVLVDPPIEDVMKYYRQ